MKKNLPNPLQLQIQRKYRTLVTPNKKDKQAKEDRKAKCKGWCY